jgi:hypothetical protein
MMLVGEHLREERMFGGEHLQTRSEENKKKK